MKGVIEKKRLVENNKTTELILELPIGILTIRPNEISYQRDNEKTEVWIHKFGCVVKKHQKANHDRFDMYDCPWKEVAVFLNEKDLIMFSRQNSPWDILVSHTDERMKIPK